MYWELSSSFGSDGFSASCAEPQSMGADYPFDICDNVQIYWCAGICVMVLPQPTQGDFRSNDERIYF